MKGFARVTLVGHLGKDPEAQYAPVGTMFCKFSIAVAGRKKKDSTEEPKTQWYNVVAFGKVAEVVSQYCKKGNIVAALGVLEVREYEYQGAQRFSLDVTANDVQLIDTRNGESAEGAEAPARPVAPTAKPLTDDELPF
jgi:single-strand DNA-binding protein